jgi:hypothetical protein
MIMKKIILSTFFVALFVSACTFSKTKMSKVRKLAVVSMFCAKQVDNNGSLVFNLMELATKDSLKLDTFAERLKNRAIADLFTGGNFTVIHPDSITSHPDYHSLSTSLYSTTSFFGFASPKGYKAVNSLDGSNFPKLRKMYPEADAFAFIRVNYHFQKRASVGSGMLSGAVGFASICCTYEVIVYSKEGKKISYDNTLTYSDLFPFMFTSTMSSATAKYIDQADNSCYGRMSRRIKRHLASLEGK